MPTKPHARTGLTYRPGVRRYEWLRTEAYTRRITIQAVLDEAVDRLIAQTQPVPNASTPIPGQYDLDGQAAK
jgi:hypothetical protein